MRRSTRASLARFSEGARRVRGVAAAAAGAAVLAALAHPAAAALPTVLDAASIYPSAQLVLQTGPAGIPSNPYANAAPNYGFDFYGPRVETLTLNTTTGAAVNGVLTPGMATSGASAVDFQAVACLASNSQLCVAGGASQYVQTAKAGIYLSTDGGTTWSLSYMADATRSDAWGPMVANYHTSSVISVAAKNWLAWTKDGGASWTLYNTPRPDNPTGALYGDQGAIHIFSALANGGTQIAFHFLPVSLQTGNHHLLYSSTITISSGAVATPTLLKDFGTGTSHFILSYTQPDENIGFVTFDNAFWVSTNRGVTWTQITSIPLSQYGQLTVMKPSCPRSTAGRCYTRANDAWYKATFPFTSWTSFSVTLPALTVTGASSWSLGAFNGYRVLECIADPASATADRCAFAVYIGIGGNNWMDVRLVTTTDSFATTSNKPLAKVLGSSRGWATYPSIVNTTATGPFFAFGGARGTLVKLSADTTTLTKMSPASGVVGTPAAGGYFSDGTCAFVSGGGSVGTCATGSVVASSNVRYLWDAAGWTSVTDAAITAGAVFDASTILLGVSRSLFDDNASLEYNGGTTQTAILGAGGSHGIYLTTDGGASLTKVCTPYSVGYTCVATNCGSPATTQIKLVYNRASGSSSARTETYIVHPFAVYQWDGSATGSSCGTTLMTATVPSDISALRSSNTLDLVVALGIGCSPDASRGCTLVKGTVPQSEPSYLSLESMLFTAVGLYNDCGTPGAFNSAPVYTFDMTNPVANYAGFMGASADVIYGSAATGFAFVPIQGVSPAFTADGRTWATCSLTSTGCFSTVLDTATTGYIMAAAFASPSVAYAYFGAPAYGSASPTALLKLTYTYSNGVGAMTGSVVQIGDVNSFIISDAMALQAYALLTQPRFFPVVETSGATGCAALPNAYTLPVTVVAAPTPSVTASATPSTSATASASVSGTPSRTPSVSPSTSITPTTSVSSSRSPSSSITPTVSVTGSTSRTPSVTPSLSVSPSVSTSVTASASTSRSASVSISQTASWTPSRSVSASGSASVTISASRSSSASASPSRSGSVTSSPSVSPSISRSPSKTPSTSASASTSPSVSSSRSASASVTASVTMSASTTPSTSVTASKSASSSSSPSVSSSNTPSSSVTSSASSTVSASKSPSSSSSASVTSSKSPSTSVTSSASTTVTASASRSSSSSPSGSPSSSASSTSSPSSSRSASASASTSASASPSASTSPSPSSSASASPSTTTSASKSPSTTVSQSPSSSKSPSTSVTSSASTTASKSPSTSSSPSPSSSSSPTTSATASASTSRSPSVSVSSSASRSPSTTASASSSASASASVTVTGSVSITPSTSASGSVTATTSSSASNTATSSASRSASQTITATSSVTPSTSSSASASHSTTPSPSTTGSRSVTPSSSATSSGTVTPSFVPGTGPLPPPVVLSLQLSIAGASSSSILTAPIGSSGFTMATLLRAVVAQQAGIANSSVVLTSVADSTSTTRLASTDPANALGGAPSGSCSAGPATSAVNVTLDLTLPPMLLAALGGIAGDDASLQAVAASIQATAVARLTSSGASQPPAVASFLQDLSACTGASSPLGVAAVAPPVVLRPVEDSGPSAALLGGAIGGSLGGAALCALCVFFALLARRRKRRDVKDEVPAKGTADAAPVAAEEPSV